jgi:hypothetical protein
VFARVAGTPRTNELFDQVLGPFPAGVEPFSLVPRAGLDRVLAQLRLEPGQRLLDVCCLDVCCGRDGIGSARRRSMPSSRQIRTFGQ